MDRIERKSSAVVASHELTKEDILEQLLYGDEPQDFWDSFLGEGCHGEPVPAKSKQVWDWLWKDGQTDEAYDLVMQCWNISPSDFMRAYWAQGGNEDFFDLLEDLPYEHSSAPAFWKATLEMLAPAMRSQRLDELGIS